MCIRDSNNIVTIDQLGTATNNKASVTVANLQSGNEATIEQTGTAMGNEAGIYQEGSDDWAKITQTGNTNHGGIYQQAGTGQNMAMLTQANGKEMCIRDRNKGSLMFLKPLQSTPTTVARR